MVVYVNPKPTFNFIPLFCLQCSLEVTRAAVLAKVQGACNNLVSLKYANCPQIPTHYCTWLYISYLYFF